MKRFIKYFIIILSLTLSSCSKSEYDIDSIRSNLIENNNNFYRFYETEVNNDTTTLKDGSTENIKIIKNLEFIGDLSYGKYNPFQSIKFKSRLTIKQFINDKLVLTNYRESMLKDCVFTSLEKSNDIEHNYSVTLDKNIAPLNIDLDLGIFFNDKILSKTKYSNNVFTFDDNIFFEQNSNISSFMFDDNNILLEAFYYTKKYNSTRTFKLEKVTSGDYDYFKMDHKDFTELQNNFIIESKIKNSSTLNFNIDDNDFINFSK